MMLRAVLIGLLGGGLAGSAVLAQTASEMPLSPQAAPPAAGPANPTAAGGSDPGRPGAAAPQCDAACVRANMERAAQACARPIETEAPIDYEWLTRPYTGLFQEADQSDGKSAVVLYRGDSIRFLNPQKDWVRVTYECAFDVSAGKVAGVRLRPGRLNQAPVQAAAAPAPAGHASAGLASRPAAAGSTSSGPASKPGEPQVRADLLAAAIKEAADKRRGAAPGPKAGAAAKPAKVGETNAIEIDQIDPRRARP